jgi:hypothetical protein
MNIQGVLSNMVKRIVLAAVLMGGMLVPAWTLELQDITESDARNGLKEALLQGANRAVGKLGRTDGFLKNRKVKIPLPESLKKLDGVMGFFGMDDDAEELVLAMNRAAEAAVPEAGELLGKAVRKMTLEDARAILGGDKTSATRYFRRKSAKPLRKKFLPVVRKATRNVSLAEKFNKVAGQASALGLLDPGDASIHEYVTRKALDGLFLMIAREEKKIRNNPAKQASSLLRKVFGAL